jgi:hypothetical protein
VKRVWLRLAGASILSLALSIGWASIVFTDDLQPDRASVTKIKPFTATRVIDSRSHVVGTLFVVGTGFGLDLPGQGKLAANDNQAAALVGFDDSFYLIRVSLNGFADQSSLFLFANADCSGQAYLPVHDPALLFSDAASGDGEASVAGGILYFAQQPFSQANFLGTGFGRNPTEAVSACFDNSPGTTTQAGAVGSFNLSLLGFIPPFRLK